MPAPKASARSRVDPAWAKLPSGRKHTEVGDPYYDEYVNVVGELDGDDIPTSEFTKFELLDGTMENNATFTEKRAIADQVPQWNPQYCIECNQCAFVCPHATIRPFLLNADEFKAARKS
jgi:pyruvate-ferredoxin/flavodoxin oxidoreductase